MTTSIRHCTCEHAAQDKMHGRGMRVFNSMVKAPDGQPWRCTVCGRVEKVSAPRKIEQKEK